MARRLVSFLLYPVFALWLVIPWIRRHRRHPRWWVVRLALAVVGAAVLFGVPALSLRLAGGALLVLAAWLPPVPDPDRLRQIAEAFGAPHILNGGWYRQGSLPAPPGTPLLLLLSADHLLVVPEDRPEVVLLRHSLDSLAGVRLDGCDYQPRYVSFAKEPPRREPQPVQSSVVHLRIDLGSNSLETEYRGVFARHLAEVAAHTLRDLARRRPALPVIG